MRYVTVGLGVLAGAALLEAALIPGILIGGAAVLAPPFVQRKLRQGLWSLLSTTTAPRAKPASPTPAASDPATSASALIPRFELKQAVAKTITFRLIVTTLDFSTNYIVIGQFATAAGLSAFGLVACPLFYLAHEAAWNYLGPPAGGDVKVAVNLPGRSDTTEPAAPKQINMSRALAKTITFRTAATIMDFTTNYVFVGDLAVAAGLSAFAFVVGPFVYLGHEKLWDFYGSRADVPAPPALPPQARLLPAPA
jgi:uncharacterized membrane protein